MELHSMAWHSMEEQITTTSTHHPVHSIREFATFDELIVCFHWLIFGCWPLKCIYLLPMSLPNTMHGIIITFISIVP